MSADFVAPVVDYEPPAFGGPPVLPPAAALRRPHRAPAGRAGDGSDTVQADKIPTAAAIFADAALRRILEVIDRRRPLAQLRPLLAVGLVDSLLSGAPGAGGPACLRRVRAQPTGPDGRAAEVSAQYTRGGRVHAIACRVEQVGTPTGTRWQVSALHLG